MLKTIEIDEDAFARLQEARINGESWSELIRRCVRPRRTFEEIMKTLDGLELSDETVEAMDEAVNRRRQAPPSRRTL